MLEQENLFSEIIESDSVSYTGSAILPNGNTIYLIFSNYKKLCARVCTQFDISYGFISNESVKHMVLELAKLKTLEEIDKNRKKLELYEKYKKFFKNEGQFEQFFNYCYGNDKKIKQIKDIADGSSMTVEDSFRECKKSSGELASFVVCASVSPISLLDLDIHCPVIFSDRNIFMVMTCSMKINDPTAIAVNHYGIMRDPSSLLGLTPATDNASMLLHGFAASISLIRYGKYLQVNRPKFNMGNIMGKSGLMIYRKEELLADISLPDDVRSYLENIQSLENLEYRQVPGNQLIAIKLTDLSKLYRSNVSLNQARQPSILIDYHRCAENDRLNNEASADGSQLLLKDSPSPLLRL